ncbi:MAG: hypothetical protein LUH18_07375 [Oscillospiraceae bacterium]|nr:hypothetical protein [Oscillospiraceae bacterium]
MSKPGKFRIDTSFEGTFNKFFDLTGDGKATFEDFFIWKQILDHDVPDTKPASTPIFSSSVSKHDWQSEASEGDDYDIDPYDYDSPEEYYEEVEMRELEETDTKPKDVSDKSVSKPLSESDFPNKRSYDAAYVVRMYEHYPADSVDESKELRVCKYISEGSSIASKYLTRHGAFLFTQAIKENFELPIELPDEDEFREIDPCNSLRKIARYDADLALKAWNWILDEFMPPMKELELELGNFLVCTEYVLSNLDEYPKGFMPKFKKYIVEHPDFAELLFGSLKRVNFNLVGWVINSLEKGNVDEALGLLTPILKNPNFDGDDKERLLESVLDDCYNYNETDTIKRFRDYVLPLFMTYADEPMKARKPDWDLDVEDYIKDIDGRKLKAQARAELQKKESEVTNNPDKLALANAFHTGENLPEVHEFCRVLLNQSGMPYSYLTNGLDLGIGDRVIVPVGADNKELTGIVVSIEKHTALTAPYPVERVKKVIRKQNS